MFVSKQNLEVTRAGIKYVFVFNYTLFFYFLYICISFDQLLCGIFVLVLHLIGIFDIFDQIQQIQA